MALELWNRVGDDPDAIAAEKLRSLRRLVLVSLAFEGVFVLAFPPYSEARGLFFAIALAMGACAFVGWRDRFGRSAIVVAAVLEFMTIAAAFPTNANHQFFALALLVLMALIRPGNGGGALASDARVALQAVRWIALSGLFWAGVVKLFSGYWIGGEFLSYRIAIDPRFAWIFASVVPDPELARLVALENRVSAGPFRADAPLLLAISNLTWIAEILLPIGLLFDRTRAAALGLALFLLIAIQLGAREVFFAGLMSGALLLFARRDRIGLLVPVVAIVYAVWLVRSPVAQVFGMGGVQ